jgi:ketosteroid isomerase-like protein
VVGDDAPARTEVLAVLERFRLGWERLDPALVLSTVARRQDVVVYGTDAAERWVGYGALVEPFRAQAAAFSHAVYTWSDGPRVWVRGEAAWACGELRVRLMAGGREVEATMRSTFVLSREADDWRIVHAHFSVGAQAPVADYASS